MFAIICRAEEGTLFAPLPADARQQPRAADEAADTDGADRGRYSFPPSYDEEPTQTTSPTSPVIAAQPPPSVRATREEVVLRGLADVEISPCYPPYAFNSPGDGAMSRSQGRRKVPNRSGSEASGSCEQVRGLPPREIFQ